MTWKDLEKNKIYVNEFYYRGRMAAIIFQHTGVCGESRRRHLIDAIGNYSCSKCLASDSTFRLPTPEEEQSLLKHLKPEKHYEIY